MLWGGCQVYKIEYRPGLTEEGVYGVVRRRVGLVEPGQVEAAVDALLPGDGRTSRRATVGVQQAPTVQAFLPQSILAAKLGLVPGMCES